MIYCRDFRAAHFINRPEQILGNFPNPRNPKKGTAQCQQERTTKNT